MERQGRLAVIVIVNMSGFGLNKQPSFVYSVKRSLQTVGAAEYLVFEVTDAHRVNTASPGMSF